jgi:phosphatidylglycerol:prolipoprotein diacylglycerol transferase
MLDFTPNPVAFTIGPLSIGWYGIGYAVGLAAVYLLLYRLAKRAGEDQDILGNGIIIVAIAALIGGRAYHVIDQWDLLYKDDPVKIFLPPYSGLGVYGGIITGTIAAFFYIRYKKAPFMRWADIVAPGLFVMQAIARWGNFFNQELYGSPTTLPWGIPIECTHRIADFPCDRFPFETTRFQPLFLYESISGAIGALVLIWMGYHLRKRLRPGDLLLTFFVWYGLTRFFLETLRHDNWTFFGVPTAQVVSLAFVIPAIVILMWRHRGRPIDDDPPTFPAVATWGAIGRPVDPDAFDEGFDDDEGYDNLFPDEIEAAAADSTDAPEDAGESSTDAPDNTGEPAPASAPDDTPDEPEPKPAAG